MFLIKNRPPKALDRQTYTKIEMIENLADLHHALETASIRAIKNADMEESQEIAMIQDMEAFIAEEYRLFLRTRKLN